MGRGRPGGNPDFGAKHRFDYGRDKPLAGQVSTRIPEETRLQLKEIAQKKNCTVPDLVRAAIERYIAEVGSEADGEVENAA
jgi:hypothetical protein